MSKNSSCCVSFFKFIKRGFFSCFRNLYLYRLLEFNTRSSIWMLLLFKHCFIALNLTYMLLERKPIKEKLMPFTVILLIS